MSKEKWIRELNEIAQDNANNLKAIAKPLGVYSKKDPRARGLLGQHRNFRSNDNPINIEKNAVWGRYQPYHWENLSKIEPLFFVSSSAYSGPRYRTSALQSIGALQQPSIVLSAAIYQTAQTCVENYIRHLDDLTGVFFEMD